MGAFAAAAALVTALGTVASMTMLLSIGLLFTGAVVASVARIGGESAAMIGTLALVLLCVSLGWPAPSELAGPRVGMALSGCAISIALSLLFSPEHAHLAQQKTGTCSRQQAEAPGEGACAALALDAVLRHAARVALTVSIAATLAAWMDLVPAFWATAAVVIVLQPDSGATIHRAIQYSLGTVLGAGAAALLAPFLRSPTLLGIVLFPLSVLALAVRPLNYGLFILLVTPVYLLMAEVLGGGSHLVTARILSVFIGCGLAFAAQLVRPGRKRSAPGVD
jgi:uncharacterized membrane protein YccC